MFKDVDKVIVSIVGCVRVVYELLLLLSEVLRKSVLALSERRGAVL